MAQNDLPNDEDLFTRILIEHRLKNSPYARVLMERVSDEKQLLNVYLASQNLEKEAFYVQISHVAIREVLTILMSKLKKMKIPMIDVIFKPQNIKTEVSDDELIAILNRDRKKRIEGNVKGVIYTSAMSMLKQCLDISDLTKLKIGDIESLIETISKKRQDSTEINKQTDQNIVIEEKNSGINQPEVQSEPELVSNFVEKILGPTPQKAPNSIHKGFTIEITSNQSIESNISESNIEDLQTLESPNILSVPSSPFYFEKNNNEFVEPEFRQQEFSAQPAENSLADTNFQPESEFNEPVPASIEPESQQIEFESQYIERTIVDKDNSRHNYSSRTSSVSESEGSVINDNEIGSCMFGMSSVVEPLERNSVNRNASLSSNQDFDNKGDSILFKLLESNNYSDEEQINEENKDIEEQFEDFTMQMNNTFKRNRKSTNKSKPKRVKLSTDI